VIHERADNVGPGEKLARSVVIIFEIIIQVERLPRLNGDDPVYAQPLRMIL